MILRKQFRTKRQTIARWRIVGPFVLMLCCEGPVVFGNITSAKNSFGSNLSDELLSNAESAQFNQAAVTKSKSKSKSGASMTSSQPTTKPDHKSLVGLLSVDGQTFAELAKRSGIARVQAEKPMPPAQAQVPAVRETAVQESLIVLNVEKTQNGKTIRDSAHLVVDTQAPLAESPKPEQKPVPAVPSTQSLAIIRANGKLQITPAMITFNEAGEKIHVSFTSDRTNEADFINGLSIFVRDPHLVEWNGTRRELRAKKPGRSELYIVADAKMNIVPVTIKGGNPDIWSLKVPDTLVSLDGMVQKQPTASALYPLAMQGTDSSNASNRGVAPATFSTEQAAQEARETLARDRAVRMQFARRSTTLGYTSAVVQVVDERSRPGQPGAGSVYPVAGARVRIVGTEFDGETDSTGRIEVPDLPQRSRFTVVVDHRAGVARSRLAEISTGESVVLQRIKVSREFSFDANARSAGVVQDASRASLCGLTIDTRSSGQAVAGVRVSIDVGAEGPYYFNRFGFLDRSLGQTSENGRFCYYNVEPGLALMSFDAMENAGATNLGTIPFAFHAGRHDEEDFAVTENRNFSLNLATTTTAHEQLSSDAGRAGSYELVDFIDVLPIGSDRSFNAVENGFISSRDPIMAWQGKSYVLAQASEFEPALYRLAADAANTPQVITALPRGFIEDMSVYAQIAHDPTMGAVVVEHGQMAGQGQDPITMRLIDDRGFVVGDLWIYSDAPVSRAVIFNVPPGQYSLIIETNNKYWLASETVTVFSETTSLVQTGARVVRQH